MKGPPEPSGKRHFEARDGRSTKCVKRWSCSSCRPHGCWSAPRRSSAAHTRPTPSPAQAEAQHCPGLLAPNRVQASDRSCSPHSPFRRLLGFFSTLIPRHHIWFPLSSRAAPSHYPRILFLNLFSSLFTHIPSMSPSSTMALNPIYTIRTLKCNSPALTSILTFGLKFPIT